MRKPILAVLTTLILASPAYAGLVKTDSSLTVTTKGLQPRTSYDVSCAFVSADGSGINLGQTGPTSNKKGKAVYVVDLGLLEHGLPLPGSATCWLRPLGSDFDTDPVTLTTDKPASITVTLP